jgi:arginyl-tRNA synthetase
MRKAEQHMDFDLDLAKSKTNENPVFYIQYADTPNNPNPF